MRVSDFFCGAGGFSEGFRQAGFDICFAVDKWLPAVTTYRANKPQCHAILDDVIRISNLPDEEFHTLVPDTEIIIGSPPCVAFSNSNKSGKGDKTLGIELLKAYLRIVARKKYRENSILRYWVLENVPNIKKYLQNQYSAADLGLMGEFSLKAINDSSGIYNAKYYGAPTNRKRFLCGEFPIPQKTNDDESTISLGAVLKSLGSPLDEEKETIQDCNYPDFSMPRKAVTDHQYIYIIQPFEWKTAKRLKEDKGYMGKMAFPENLDNPARTVMANMSASSRESMILSSNDGGYRLPTVREAASMMSFPIDYRFYGQSKGIKHTLVGNAVPPKMSYAIAKAIAYDANQQIPRQYIPIIHDNSIPFYNLNYVEFQQKYERSKKDVSKFKYHIPYMILDAYRVELTNYYSNFEKKKFRWTAEIHYSQGKDKAKVYRPRKAEAGIPQKLKETIQQYINQMRPYLCSFNSFQHTFCMTEIQRRERGLIGPYELLDSIKIFIMDLVPPKELSTRARVSNTLPEIPIAIIIGYHILNQITKEMGGINDECGHKKRKVD